MVGKDHDQEPTGRRAVDSGVNRGTSVEADWLRFQDAAQRYCAVIDSVGEMQDSVDLYAAIAVPLADLYAAGRRLSVVNTSDDDFEVEELSHDAWRGIFEAIDRLTGDADPYRTVFDPQEDSEVVEAALADDLADIYRDVLPAVRWNDPVHLNDLLFELWMSFQGHWARHALEAMRVIHWRHPYW